MTDKTATTRKAKQRERDRAAGFVEVLVKVHKTRVSDLREIEQDLRKPKPEPTTSAD